MPNDLLYSTLEEESQMAELISQYVQGMNSQCHKLREAITNGDLDLVKMIGHKFKGSGSGYGFPAITQAGQLLEEAAIQSRSVDQLVITRADELIQLCESAQAALVVSQ